MFGEAVREVDETGTVVSKALALDAAGADGTATSSKALAFGVAGMDRTVTSSKALARFTVAPADILAPR